MSCECVCITVVSADVFSVHRRLMSQPPCVSVYVSQRCQRVCVSVGGWGGGEGGLGEEAETKEGDLIIVSRPDQSGRRDSIPSDPTHIFTGFGRYCHRITDMIYILRVVNLFSFFLLSHILVYIMVSIILFKSAACIDLASFH